MHNKIAVAAVAALIVGGGAGFYGGIKYSQAKTVRSIGQRGFMMAGGAGGNFVFSGQAPTGGRTGGRMMNGGFVSGEVLSKDDKSLTIKSMDGGSKIVYYAGSTQISKPSPAQAGDLNVGDNVVVAGSAGSDGSITAQSIQIRPAQPSPTPSK